ncbi:MAG TPA: hypothetical protein VGK70_13060 [Thermoanaerobaculia bacterium]
MSPLSNPRLSRTGLLFLMLTLLVAGVEVWGIGASLGYLLR